MRTRWRGGDGRDQGGDGGAAARPGHSLPAGGTGRAVRFVVAVVATVAATCLALSWLFSHEAEGSEHAPTRYGSHAGQQGPSAFRSYARRLRVPPPPAWLGPDLARVFDGGYGGGGLPLAVVEEHHHAMQHWLEARRVGAIEGGRAFTLVHVDSHADLGSPVAHEGASEAFPRPLPASPRLWNVAELRNDDFIVAAVAAGLVDRLVMVHNHWMSEGFDPLAGFAESGVSSSELLVGRVAGAEQVTCVCTPYETDAETGETVCFAQAAAGLLDDALARALDTPLLAPVEGGAGPTAARTGLGARRLLADWDAGGGDGTMEGDERDEDGDDEDGEGGRRDGTVHWMHPSRCEVRRVVPMWTVAARRGGAAPPGFEDMVREVWGTESGGERPAVLLDVDLDWFAIVSGGDHLARAGLGPADAPPAKALFSAVWQLSCVPEGVEGAERRENDRWLEIIERMAGGGGAAPADGWERLASGLSLCPFVTASSAARVLAVTADAAGPTLKAGGRRLANALRLYGPGCIAAEEGKFAACVGGQHPVQRPLRRGSMLRDVSGLEGMLRLLPPPQMVTLARSLRDGFLPPGALSSELEELTVAAVARAYNSSSHHIRLVYDPRLLGGRRGWPAREGL